MSWPVRISLAVIRMYQVALGSLVGGACRFEPSCSAYASTALIEHGAWRGWLLAIRRVARCHPFGAAGIDPVPPRVEKG